MKLHAPSLNYTDYILVIFNPLASSNSNISITNCYRRHEQGKQKGLRAEGQGNRALLIHTPGVLGNWRNGQTGNHLLQKAGSLAYWVIGSTLWLDLVLATLHGISSSLLRCAIQCVHGACSSRGHFIKQTHPVDLVNSESETQQIIWTLYVRMHTIQ